MYLCVSSRVAIPPVWGFLFRKPPRVRDSVAPFSFFLFFCIFIRLFVCFVGVLIDGSGSRLCLPSARSVCFGWFSRRQLFVVFFVFTSVFLKEGHSFLVCFFILIFFFWKAPSRQPHALFESRLMSLPSEIILRPPLKRKNKIKKGK